MSTAELSENANVSEAQVRAKAIVGQSGQLATLPSITAEIIRLADDPTTSGHDLASLVNHDPVLATRILKVVNSSFYGLSGQVNSLGHAIGLLGFRALKNIAVAASLVRFLGKGRKGDFDPREIWEHSIAAASAARMLATLGKAVAPDEAFLAGLIHDLGILVEMQAGLPAFVQVLRRVESDGQTTFREAELAVFGTTHELVGAAVCEAWKFPARIRAAVEFHHRLEECPDPSDPMPMLIQAADRVAARLGLGYTQTVENMNIDPLVLATLGASDADVERIATEVPGAAREFSRILM